MKLFPAILHVIAYTGLTFASNSQVILDKPVQLSGNGGDAKIEGIKEVINPQDAASKEYVDNQISESLGGDACGGLTRIQDTRDNRFYEVIAIGNQCWFRHNLGFGDYVTASTGQGASGTQKYCYSDGAWNCKELGGLYLWSEAMNGSASCNGTGQSEPACSNPVQGICPIGWHIPSHYEFTTLERNLGKCAGSFSYDVSTTGWIGCDEGMNIQSTSGFNSLMAGFHNGSSFSEYNNRWHFWTSTEANASNAWLRLSTFGWVHIYRDAVSKTQALSVRCVKDE